MALMSQQPDRNDPVTDDPAASVENQCENTGENDARRKLRYDAPALDIPRPQFLRDEDKSSDEDAA